MTQGRLAAQMDRIVARADRDAVRRRRERQADRELSIWDSGDGLTEVFGRLFATDAHAVDARLDALAATVCADDPRTRNQRRADAMGALAAGADRLACRCGQPDCPAGTSPPPIPVVIHVVAEQASLDGTGQAPGSMIGSRCARPRRTGRRTGAFGQAPARWCIRPMRHPNPATPPRRRWPTLSAAGI